MGIHKSDHDRNLNILLNSDKFSYTINLLEYTIS